MFELLFIGLFVGGVIYVIFFFIYSIIKAEKDFSLDVYRYLSRRYPKTVVVDFGGISSDPIIHSRDAGPFKLIEVKVISEKMGEKTDQDLILRGEVNPSKFQKGDKLANLTLSLRRQQRYHREFFFNRVSDIVVLDRRENVKEAIGIPKLDERFIILSDDPLFPSNIFIQSDLGELILKSFDLEGYYIRSMDDSLTIQVRMETMSSNSFIQAFNILLGTIGALSEKGYLTRSGTKNKKQKVHVPSYSPPLREEHKILTSPSEVLDKFHEKPVHSEKQAETKLVTTVDAQEEILKPKKPIISWEPSPKVPTDLEKPIKEESVETLYQPLFTSIQYQAKEIEYEPNHVRIITFSRAMEEIIVTFPDENQALFTTLVDRFPPTEFELQIEFQGKERQTDWSDAWKDIKIIGPPDIVEKLKIRSGIAHRITNTGETKIIVQGHPNKKLECEVIVPKTIRGINAGYSLLKDVIWFFEMIFM